MATFLQSFTATLLGSGAGIGVQTITDSFNRANESPIGGNWVPSTHGLRRINLTSNQVQPSSAQDDCEAYYSPWSGSSDHYSQIAVTTNDATTGAGFGPVVRQTASAAIKTQYRLVINTSGAYELVRFNAGVGTSLRTGTVTYVAGTKLGLGVRGSTLKIWYNGIQLGTDIVDVTPIASGLPGVAFSSGATGTSTNTGDNWDAGIVGTAVPVTAFAKRVVRSMGGTSSFTGAVTTFLVHSGILLSKTVAGSLAFVGTFTKRGGKSLTAVRSFVGLIGRSFVKEFTATVLIDAGVDDTGAYSIPTGRSIDWYPAGMDVVGGIPTTHAHTTTITGLHPDNSVDDSATINSFITAAAFDTVLLIPAGVYRIDHDINMKNGVVLRGAKPFEGPFMPVADVAATTLMLNGVKIFFRGGDKTSNWVPGIQLGLSITSGYTRGSTSLTLSSVTGLAVGDYINVYQNEDAAWVDDGGRTYLGEDSGPEPHVWAQYTKITNLVGNVVTIDPPLYLVTPSPTGQSVRKQTFGITFAGLENMRLYGNNTNFKSVWFQFCRNCWIQGCEMYQTGGTSSAGAPHIWTEFCYAHEYRRNYCHVGGSHDSGANYGIEFYHWNSRHKIEDNIVQETRHSIIFEGGGSGCVILYNYTDDNWESVQGSPLVRDDTFLSEDIVSNHGAHPYMNLWEGNWAANFWGDYTQGSSSHCTLFRNSLSGKQTSYSLINPFLWTIVEIEKYNRYYNLIGNIVGNSTMTSGTVIADGSDTGFPIMFRFGYNSTGGGYTDSTSYSTALLHGNYDYVSDSVHDWADPNHILSTSLYYSSKPTFFGELSWPPYDYSSPSNNSRTRIPAGYRFVNGSDPAAGTGLSGPIAFLTKKTIRSLTAVRAFIGSLTALTSHISGLFQNFSANLMFVGSVNRSSIKRLVALLSFVGVFVRLTTRLKGIAGTLWTGVNTILDRYSETNFDATYTLPSSHGLGQTFNSGSGGTLDICKFVAFRTGLPSGNITAKLYASTGTFGTDSHPTGTALAVSDPIVATTLPTIAALVTFSFTDINRYVMSASTVYCIVVEYPAGTGGTIDIGRDQTSPSHAGNTCVLNFADVWAGQSFTDICFYVNIAGGSVATLKLRTGKNLSGTRVFVGDLVKYTKKSLRSTLSFIGSMTSLLSHAGGFAFDVTSSLLFVGTLNKRSTQRLTTSILSFSVTITKQTFKEFLAYLVASGSLVNSRELQKLLTATLSFVGSLVSSTPFRQLFTATLTFVGNLDKAFAKTLVATLLFVGQLNKQVSRTFGATLSFIGVFVRNFVGDFAYYINLRPGEFKPTKTTFRTTEAASSNFRNVRTDDNS